MSWNSVGLGGERRLERLERRQQVVGRLVERGEVHGRGEHVVGGLAHVDVVVGVRALAGEVGDHLVGVHVRRGARAGLEDVDRELVVELAGGDAVAGGRDALGVAGVEQSELGVDARRGGLDAPEPADHRDRDRLAGDREVADRLGGLAAPELLVLSRAHARPFAVLRLATNATARAAEGAKPGPLRGDPLRPSGLAGLPRRSRASCSRAAWS